MANNNQQCDATLTIGVVSRGGMTGKNAGHAEMDALDQFIFTDPWQQGNVKLAKAKLIEKLTDGTAKSVYCPSRPCCKKCSAVLQQLGFVAGANSSFSNTYNSDKMTEWGVTMGVADVLKGCGVNLANIKAL